MTAILGGGISGLSAAYYCLENPRLGPYVLYEVSNRLGGWIKTDKLPTGELFEQGPRTIRPKGLAGKNTLKLIEDLQLSPKILSIPQSHPTARNRLIYSKRKLHFLPNSITGIFKSNSLLRYPLLKYLLDDLKAPKVLKDDESLYSFTERRFGKEIADNLISPMICGICAGDAKKISVKFLMKSLFEGEQKYGSVIKGFVMNGIFSNVRYNSNETKTLDEVKYTNLVNKSKKERWSVWSLKGGLETLPRALINSVGKRGLELKLENRCDKIVFKNQRVQVTVNGEIKNHSRIISSLSAKDLSKLIQVQHPELAEELDAIPSSTVAVVNLRFEGNVLPMTAFGFLVPPQEKLPILGCIFNSCMFPTDSSTVLTVMMGGAWFEEYFHDNQSENHLLKIAVDEIKRILNIKVDPTDFNVAVLRDCIPQHIVGHDQRLNRIQKYISTNKIPLFLCGSSYRGVGLNDVILSAKQAVSDMAGN